MSIETSIIPERKIIDHVIKLIAETKGTIIFVGKLPDSSIDIIIPPDKTHYELIIILQKVIEMLNKQWQKDVKWMCRG